MTHIARLVYNTAHWQQPTNADVFANNGIGYGIVVNYREFTYRFGLEEWLFNKIPQKEKIGFLECYRQRIYADIVDKIMLITRYPNGSYYHIGNVYGVEQLVDEEIQGIIEMLLAQNWDKIIEEHFAALGDVRAFLAHTEYQNHWQSVTIIKAAGDNNDTGFCFNIKYKKIELLKTPINLTEFANGFVIGNKAGRLANRYDAINLINKLPIGNPLKQYLITQNL